MDAAPGRGRETVADSSDLGESLFGLRIIGRRVRLGSGQNQADGRVGRYVGDECLQEADRILQRIPAGHLQDDPAPRRNRTAFDLGGSCNGPLGSVPPYERGCAARSVIVDQPSDAQHRSNRRSVDPLILRSEGVDAWRHHLDVLRSQPLPHVAPAAEDLGVRGVHVGTEEVPRLPGELVRLVDADVTAPDDVGARLSKCGCEPERLRVVKHDHVAVAHHLDEFTRVVRHVAFVGRSLGRAKWSGVATLAMKLMVDALRDVEEGIVAVDHHPASPDPRASEVSEQRLKHLGDPTAL